MLKENNRTAAIILAGGSGLRFGSDKLMEKIAGVPVIVRSLRAFQECDLITYIVLVARADAADVLSELCRREKITKLTAIVPGGATRADSCLSGLAALPEDAAIAAIHDGARPLVTDEVIRNAVLAAAEYGAAIPSIPVRDTVKERNGDVVLGTPDRSALAAVQTPQCFRAEVICEAMRRVKEDGVSITDDASAAEYAGRIVHLVPGSEENIKITTPLDLRLAEIIFEGRSKK